MRTAVSRAPSAAHLCCSGNQVGWKSSVSSFTRKVLSMWQSRGALGCINNTSQQTQVACDSSDGVTEWQAWQPFPLSAVPSRLWRHQRLHGFSPWSANHYANPGFWPTLSVDFCALFILLCFQCTELQHNPNFCITLLACNTVLLFQCLAPWSVQ